MPEWQLQQLTGGWTAAAAAADPVSTVRRDSHATLSAAKLYLSSSLLSVFELLSSVSLSLYLLSSFVTLLAATAAETLVVNRGSLQLCRPELACARLRALRAEVARSRRRAGHRKRLSIEWRRLANPAGQTSVARFTETGS